MTHKKRIYPLFIIAILMSIHHIATCMQPLAEQQTQAKIDLLKKKHEVQTQKQTHQELLNAEKIAKQKAEAEKLRSDIRQNDLDIRTIDGLIRGGSQGLTEGISSTLQHGGKKIIDLWLDGSLTTAETLMELEKREDILTKRLQNTKDAAMAQRQYLKSPAEIEALNSRTYAKIRQINKELERNAQVYEQVVVGRGKQQSTQESDNNIPELPTESNKVEPSKQSSENTDATINEVKAKTTLFAGITAFCGIAATKAGKCADTLASYSFAYITTHPRLKETFIGKHSTGVNQALVATAAIILAYSAYSLYKAKTQTDDNDDDIFADDDNY